MSPNRESRRLKHAKPVDSYDRDYATGEETNARWMGRPSEERRRDAIPFGPQMRVMQLDRGTVKN